MAPPRDETTIVGCVLFAFVFYDAKLYADVTLQAFFISTAGIGWWRWLHGCLFPRRGRPITSG